MDPEKRHLLRSLQIMREELDRLEKMIDQKIPENHKEWFHSKEFARIEGVKPKTVTNYCSKGELEHIKKDAYGRWMVHRCEITNPNYN